jgi:Stigma-specific protein, Stig1
MNSLRFDALTRLLATPRSRRAAARLAGLALVAVAAGRGDAVVARGRNRRQCPAGQTRCHGVCVDLASDADHCGACHVACAPGQMCLQGACGPVRDPAPCPTDGPSGIRGQVSIGPTCPVERPDHPCPDRPFAAALRIEDASGRLYCTSRSGDDGAFLAAVPPGDYIVDPVDPNPGVPPFGQPVKATVKPNRFTDVTVHFDSGIR